MTSQVDLITRHSIRNYGSFLQTLATQELLNEAGGEVRVVDYRQPNVDDTGWSFAARGKAAKYGKAGIAAYAMLRDANVRRMGKLFEAASRGELQMTDRTYRGFDELRASDEFHQDSLYCVGSDQVWNVSYNGDNRPYYLDFAPVGARKFSLSSSIGMSKLPENDEAALVASLRTFDGISVREAEAAAYLQSFGLKVSHHVDPVLGVPRSFWEGFGSPHPVDDPYLLVYQLNPSSVIPSVVAELAKALSLQVRRIEYWRFYRRGTGGRQLVLPTPQEFVGLFRDASFVVTDSFHGTAFSTIFDRPFVATEPPKFSGRIRSLLATTDRQDLLVDSAESALHAASSFGERPSTEGVLSAERLKVSRYLDRMFERTRENVG